MSEGWKSLWEGTVVCWRMGLCVDREGDLARRRVMEVLIWNRRQVQEQRRLERDSVHFTFS